MWSQSESVGLQDWSRWLGKALVIREPRCTNFFQGMKNIRNTPTINTVSIPGDNFAPRPRTATISILIRHVPGGVDATPPWHTWNQYLIGGCSGSRGNKIIGNRYNIDSGGVSDIFHTLIKIHTTGFSYNEHLAEPPTAGSKSGVNHNISLN